jgi:dienelactone hydrolase
MKFLSALLLSVIAVSCSHTTKYSPELSFKEDGKTFSSKVQLPEKFEEKLPLVIIVHEWWGRTSYIEKRGQMLNKEGYATLAVDLYGDAKTVETPTEAQALATPFYQKPELGVEKLKKYIELAKKDPHVDPERIFVIGYCFGGTQALNLARSGENIKGVVSFHGGLATTYPTKNIKAKVLALNGKADPMVPAKEVKAFEQEMKKAKATYKSIDYPNIKSQSPTMQKQTPLLGRNF